MTSRGALFAALLMLAAASPCAAALRCVEHRARDMHVLDCRASGITLIETRRPLKLIYHPVAPPTPRQLVAAGWAVVVNGSYHDGDYANARLDGQFTIHGKRWGEARPGDKQLSHVLTLDAQGLIDAIAAADELALARAAGAAASMQTGPLITLDGAWVAEYATASLNGNQAYKRSAIGRTADGTGVIVIARRPLTLEALAREVLALRRFAQRGLTLVNLDGGLSTALAVRRTPALNYQPDKFTPVAIGVRQ